MRKIHLIKIGIAAVVLTTGFTGFLFTRTPEIQTVAPLKSPENVPDAKSEVAGYKNWTKVNDKAEIMESDVAIMCAPATQLGPKNPHKDKFINVYINSIGKDEMLTKKNPQFPVGTVVVKEKLSAPDSPTPELLTVMIKREKDFNPEVGDWEFLTFNGDATEITARGKLESCQACHLGYKQNDFITRTYLPDEIKQKLK